MVTKKSHDSEFNIIQNGIMGIMFWWLSQKYFYAWDKLYITEMTSETGHSNSTCQSPTLPRL